jgi:hypothetical protein
LSGNKCDDDSGGSDVSECKESETSKYVPHGLEYSDDDNILIDIDSDEEELRSSFPRDIQEEYGSRWTPKIQTCQCALNPKERSYCNVMQRLGRPTLTSNEQFV